MTIEQIKCPNCAASLSDVGAQEVVRCTFCDSEFRLDEARQAARSIAERSGGGAGRSVFAVLVAVIAMAGLGLLAGIVVVMGVATSSSQRTPAPLPELPELPPELASAARRSGAVSPSELPTLTSQLGWVTVEAPGMIGEYSAFPLIENLTWLRGISRAWSADAVLKRLSVEGVRADGTLDISARDGWDVEARYASPTLRESATKMAEVSETKLKSEFRLTVEAGELKALFSEPSRSELGKAPPPDYLPECTLAGAMEVWSAHGLPPRPHYTITWQYLEPRAGREEGYWRMSVGSEVAFDREADPPMLDPTTCAPL